MKQKITLSFLLIISIICSVSFASSDSLKSLDVYLINQNPNPVYAGDVFEITLGIENAGYGTIDDISLKIDDTYPFTVISENTIDLGTIFSSDDYTYTRKISLKAEPGILEGTYDLIVEEIKGSSVIEHTISLEISSNKNIEIVSINKNSISPGSIEDIIFTIKNVGSSDLSNIEFSWEDEEKVILPVNGDNKVFIDSLSAGEERNVSYTISSSNAVSPDLYKIYIDLSYENSKTSQFIEETSNAGIYVGGATLFDIILDEISSEEYIFTIANIGSNDASSVKVSVDSSLRTTSKSAEIIGDLNKGDYTTISYELLNPRDTVPLIVEYTDTSGKRNSQTIDIDISSQTQVGNSTMMRNTEGTFERPQGNQERTNPMSGMQNGVETVKSGLLTMLYLVIGAGVLFVGYKYIRKKKTQK